MTDTQVEPIVTYGVFGKGMLKNNAQLQAFLQAYNGQDAQVKRVYPLLSTTDGITAMLGWGRKKATTARAVLLCVIRCKCSPLKMAFCAL